MNKNITEEELLDKLKKSYSIENYEQILKAYNFSRQAHSGQKRVSGEDYFIHPCAVVDILIDLGMDYVTIIAAFLHDVLEDTPVTREQMLAEFGEETVELVEGVTKLEKIKFQSKEEEQAENLRKMFMAMANDIRVIIIKLADRLHNMRSLSFLPEDRQLAISRETLEIYAPLAGRLGMSNIKCELEDLCMRYLYPDEYYKLVELVSQKRLERQQFVDRVTHELQDKLKEIGIHGEVNGRPKHFYSIYKKMKSQSKEFDQIYDLFALRVIVDTVKDCYAVLGAIHTMYKPIPGRFKDYIAMPKPNLYQSLHTTVMTNYGTPFEIQIRTYEMHRTAEYGIAAHWKYKEGNTLTNKEMDDKIRWIREVMDLQGDIKDSRDFLDSLKIDIFNDEVFVFTPKGDVVNLPIGSTVVDFAYHIHSKIGDKCIGGKVNSKMVPLSTRLKTGDIVEILTSNSAKGPSRDWLNFVKSSTTKTKINQFFKKEMREENIKIGKDMLEKEAKRRGFNLGDILDEKYILNAFSKYSYTQMDDVFASIGYGGTTTAQIINKLLENYNKTHTTEDLITLPAQQNETEETRKNKLCDNDVIIKGNDGDLLIRLSKCCNPVPRDPIIGYISRGRGVSIHRADCPNIRSLEPNRKIEATWSEAISKTFVASFNIYAENRGGLIAEISTLLSNNKIGINMINAKLDKDDIYCNIALSIELKDVETLDYILKKISQIKGIIDVHRL